MDDFEKVMELLGLGALSEAFSALGFSLLIYSVLYILTAVGIFEMAKKTNIKNPVLAFIPVVNIYTFGKIAQCYVKKDGTESSKFGISLLILKILKVILAVLFSVVFVTALISTVSLLLKTDFEAASVTSEMFSSFIPVIIFYFALFVAAIIYKVIYYIALWRIFGVFNSSNATLFTVLSIFFNFLPPIFLFASRKRLPENLNKEENYFFS